MAERFVATVTPTGVGSAGTAGAAVQEQAKGNRWGQAFQTVQQVGQAAVAVSAAETKRTETQDALSGKLRAATEMGEASQLDDIGKAEFYQARIDQIESGESGDSDSHNKSYLSAVWSTYNSALVKKKEVETDRAINAETLAVSDPGLWQGGYNMSTAVSDISERLGVSKGSVRDSLMNNVNSFYTSQYFGATSAEDVAEIDARYSKVREGNNSSEFYGSRSKTFKTLSKESDLKVAQAKTSVLKAIDSKNKMTIKTSENKDDPSFRAQWPEHPHINKGIYPNEFAYNQAVAQYEKHSTDLDQANNYDTEKGTNFNALDDGAKNVVKQDITTSIINNFDDLDGQTLVNTLISQKQNAGNGISHIKSNLYSVDEEASAVTFAKIQQLRGQPNGEEAMNVLFSDEGERSKYDAIVALQESGIVGSMYEANKYMNQPKTAWKFDSKQDERKYTALFKEVPVNLANRGKNTYKALRSRGVDHAVAFKAAESSIEARADVGGVTIHGSKQPFENSEAVKSSIGTQLNHMTKNFGEDIVHSYDMWSNSIVSTNEYGVIINTSNRDELVGLSTTVAAFKRDAHEHRVRRGIEKIGDDFNSQVQKFVRLKGKSIVGVGDSFNDPSTDDTLWNALTRSYGPSSFARRKRIEEESVSTFMNKKGGNK